MAVQYIETYLGNIEIQPKSSDISDGYILSKKAEKKLAKLGRTKQIQTGVLENENGLWLAVFPKCKSKKEAEHCNMLGHFKIQTVKCMKKHYPCDRRCNLKYIDYPLE